MPSGTKRQALAGVGLAIFLSAVVGLSDTRPSGRRSAAEEPTGGSGARLIVPGQRAGPLRLHESLGQLRAALQANSPPGLRKALALKGPSTNLLSYLECGTHIDEVDWPPVVPPRNAPGPIFIFLSHGHIFQIESGSSAYHTAGGLTAGSLPGQVKREFANLEAYVLRNDHSIATNDRDLIYWVGKAKGIAFAFVYAGPRLGRRVWTIDVFKPGTDFRPGGCVEYPQKWEKLAPYTIALPDDQATDRRPVDPRGAH